MSDSGMSYDYQRIASSEREAASLQQSQKKATDLIAKLRSSMSDLEATMKEGSTDGKWDPVQGIAEDLVDDSKKLLKAAKEVNKARDSRNEMFMR